jgi:hypothetical protein
MTLSVEEKKERHRQSQRRWRSNNLSLVHAYNEEYSRTRGLPARHQQCREWRQKNPEKSKCHYVVWMALRRGEIQRMPLCETCQNPTKTQAHHDDYTKPLKIKWLCATCHAKLHVPIRESNL